MGSLCVLHMIQQGEDKQDNSTQGKKQKGEQEIRWEWRAESRKLSTSLDGEQRVGNRKQSSRRRSELGRAAS